MSLLSICQSVASDVGIATPATIIGNTDAGAQRILAQARRAGRSLARRANWTNLVTEHVFFANGGSDYPLPSDFRSLVGDTLWDRTRFWKMRGALSPQQWQLYKSSPLGRATIERRWRIRMPDGAADGAATVFSIDPDIGATDTTSQFVFEYVSTNWCRSATLFSLEEAVVALGGTGFAIGDTGTLSGGTFTTAAQILVTGVNAGVITSAEVLVPGSYTVVPGNPAGFATTSGAGIGAQLTINSATFPTQTQPDWVADTDTGVLDENLIELGTLWRVMRRLGIAYDEEKDEYEREVDRAIARDGGTAILQLSPRSYFDGLWGPGNVQVNIGNTSTNEGAAMSTIIVNVSTALPITTSGNVLVNNTSGAVLSITLPVSPVVGQTITVKDIAGNANQFNITVKTPDGSLIDGSATFIMAQNYQSGNFIFGAVGWGQT